MNQAAVCLAVRAPTLAAAMGNCGNAPRVAKQCVSLKAAITTRNSVTSAGATVMVPKRRQMMSRSEFMEQFVHDLIERYEADVLPTGLLYLELRRKGHGVLIVE